jgi:predicted transcriptional regulator
MIMADNPSSTVDLAANLTIAWLNNPNVRANNDDATAFLQSMHSTLSAFTNGSGDDSNGGTAAGDGASNTASSPQEGAVSVRKSLASPNHIISMIDGKPYSTLKRHLGRHGLTPAQYRERFGLKPDYPMVAPAYAEKRRELAKKIGLGSKPGMTRKAATASKPATAPKTAKRRGRPPKAATPA